MLAPLPFSPAPLGQEHPLPAVSAITSDLACGPLAPGELLESVRWLLTPRLPPLGADLDRGLLAGEGRMDGVRALTAAAGARWRAAE